MKPCREMELGRGASGDGNCASGGYGTAAILGNVVPVIFSGSDGGMISLTVDDGLFCCDVE